MWDVPVQAGERGPAGGMLPYLSLELAWAFEGSALWSCPSSPSVRAGVGHCER